MQREILSERKSVHSLLKKYNYIFLALYVPVYIGLFFVVEHIITPAQPYWSSYCTLDDCIPFKSYFVIFYCMWYPLLVFVGLFLMFFDVPEYKLYMYALIIGFTFSLLFCLIFPNGQDLRPKTMPNDDVFTRFVWSIYASDTNTNVIPSVHVYGAILAAVAAIRSKAIKYPWIKVFIVVIAGLVAVSTCFIKQHSILDGAASILLYAAVYAIVYVFINKHLKKS